MSIFHFELKLDQFPNPIHWPSLFKSSFKILQYFFLKKKGNTHTHNRNELTATVILPRIGSGTDRPDFLVSLSKHVDINSIQIHTSASVIKHPMQWTMYGQSCDFSTTSISMMIRFSSSWLFVRRICWKLREKKIEFHHCHELNTYYAFEYIRIVQKCFLKRK